MYPHRDAHSDTTDWPGLIARARAGEARAWDELFAIVRPWAQTRLATRVRDFHAREDLTQEVMITLCRRLDTLREPARFAGWFCTLVDNAAHAWGRRRQAQLRLEDALQRHAGDHDAATSPDAPSVGTHRDEGRRARLAVAFHALSREHQAVMRGRYLAGRGYGEIARLLDLPEQRVRGRLQKARHQLKQHFQTIETMNPPIASHPLNAAHLATLRAATRFLLHEEKRPVLASLCLEPGGRVLATDGRRLLFRQVSGLAGLDRRLVLGPCRADTFAGLESGRLRPELSRFVFEDEAGREHELPLFTEREYPTVDQARPARWAFALRFTAKTLRAALADLEPMLAARHPALAEHGYSPHLRLRARPAEAALHLETDHLTGYFGERATVAKACAATLAWRYDVGLNADATEGEWPEPERILGLNATYLADALDALELAPTESCWLRWPDAPNGPLGVEASAGESGGERLALIMPVLLN